MCAAITRLAKNKEIYINYDSTKKSTNFDNQNYVYCLESIEILINNSNLILLNILLH